MDSFIERDKIECKCGAYFWGQYRTYLDPKGNVLMRDRINARNGIFCPKCNIENRKKYDKKN